MASPNPSELLVSKLEALPKQSSSTNTTISTVNDKNGSSSDNYGFNNTDKNVKIARPYDTKKKCMLPHGPKPPVSLPNKHQHKHNGRFISQQFESSSTYPVSAPFHTSSNFANVSDFYDAAKQVETYSQLYPSNGVPLRILQMGDGLSQVSSNAPRSNRIKMKKNKNNSTIRTEKERDFIANELEVFEIMLESFLKQSIKEREFFKKFESQRADSINLETKKSFLMLRSFYEVVIGTTSSISKNDIIKSMKVVSQLACKLLSAEYAQVSQTNRKLWNDKSNNNNNNDNDTVGTHMEVHESAYINGMLQTLDSDIHKDGRGHISLNININKKAKSFFNTSMQFEATRVSKLVYDTGSLVNIPNSCDYLERDCRKAVLCVPIKDSCSIRGTIAVVGKKKSRTFSKIDIVIMKYLASLVTLLLKPEGKDAATQTACDAHTFDKMFRIFRTDTFARHLENCDSLLELYSVMQTQFELSLHDANVSVLLFIDPHNDYQLTMFNTKTRNIVPVAPTTFINIILEAKAPQFLTKDCVDFSSTCQDIMNFAEKINVPLKKKNNFIVGIPCVIDNDNNVMAILLSVSDIILPKSQINAALDSAWRSAKYVSKTIDSRELRLRDIRERVNIEEKLKNTEEKLFWINRSTKSACELISTPVKDGDIWQCAKNIENSIRDELKADKVKLRFIRTNTNDVNNKSLNNVQDKIVYLRQHESFGNKITVEEVTNLKDSIIAEAFQAREISIIRKSRQENALIRNKFQHISSLLHIDEEWVTENVHQLCFIPLSKYPLIARKNINDSESVDYIEGEPSRKNNVVAIVLVRVYAGMIQKWDHMTTFWLNSFCSIVGPWLAGHVKVNNISKENKILKESSLQISNTLKLLCNDIENGLYQPKTDDLLHLAALTEISLNTTFISIYKFKEEPKSKFGTISWLFKKAYIGGGDDANDETSASTSDKNATQMKEIIRYPKDVRSQYKSFSLDAATINIVRETGKLVTKSINIIEGITTVVHVSPMCRGKHDVFGLCVFVQETNNRSGNTTSQCSKNTNDDMTSTSIITPVKLSAAPKMNKEMFRLCTNAFTECTKRLNHMQKNSQLISTSKELFEIWDIDNANFNNFLYFVESIIDKFTKLFEAEDVTIFISNEKENFLWVPPMTDQEIAIPHVLPLKSVVAGHSIIKGKLLNVKDMETCFFESLDAEVHDEHIGRKAYKTLMSCPIYRNKTTIFGAIEVTNKNNANDDDQDATGASVAFTDDDCKLLEFLTSLIGRGMYHSYCKNEEELLKLVKQGIERVASIEEEENNTAAQNN